MKTIFFSLLSMVFYSIKMLNATEDSNYTKTNIDDLNSKNDDNLFIKVEGLQNIFNFFTNEMDIKLTKCKDEEFFDKNSTLLSYNFHKTFLKNVPLKYKNTDGIKSKRYNHHELKKEIFDELGREETPILFGLDNILINYSRNKGIYLCRTGLVKSQNGYFILQRNLIVDNKSKQFFKIKKISEDDTFFLWKNWNHFGQRSAIIWINVDKETYFEFKVTPENIKYNGFEQHPYIHRDLSQFQNHANGIFTAKQIMENERIKFSELNHHPTLDQIIQQEFLQTFEFADNRNRLLNLEKYSTSQGVFDTILNEEDQIWNENYFNLFEFPGNQNVENENQFSGPPGFENQFFGTLNQMTEEFSTFGNVFEQHQILQQNEYDKSIFIVGNEEWLNDLKKNYADHEDDDEKSDVTSQTTQEDENYKRKKSLISIFEDNLSGFDDLLSETPMEIPRYVKEIWEENQDNNID